MHDCHNCGQACDCDGEDTWNPTPSNCRCPCDGDDFDDEAESFGAQSVQDREWEKYQEAMRQKKK